MNENYSFLIKKLDEFIRKYYINLLLKGILYSIAIILISFLVFILAENQFYFTPLIRKFIFFSFVLISLFSILIFIINPILKLNSLGAIISHYKAAEIIGKHFTNVEDKLLNILQLKESSLSLTDAALIEASINQKSNDLKPVPFSSAIDLQENRKYLKYALPPILLFLLLLFFRPSIISDSTHRLVQNNKSFEKPMPFQFIIKNENLNAIQFEDFILDIKLEGKEIPNEIFIVNSNIKHSVQKLNTTNFTYVFSNLQKGTKFYFEAAGFKSKEFFIDVKVKPLITNFQLKIKYPPYISLKDENILDTGDISVPEGSQISWIFDAQATDKISMQFSDSSIIKNNSGNNTFIFDKVLFNSDKYIVKIFNNELKSIDSSSFNISVIKDAFPQIEVEEYLDTTNNDVYFYIGKIIDDYGLVALNFNYIIEKVDGLKITKKNSIPFSGKTISEFSFFWNLKEKGISPGDKLSYYFEVFDNDQINGSKSTRSKWMTMRFASKDELKIKSDNELKEIQNELKKSIEKSAELQKDFKKIQEELLMKEEVSWQTKKEIEKLINEQKEFHKEINKLENKFKENINQQEDFKKVNPDIKKKQEQVQKLFEEVLSDEMKAMIDKLEKLIEEMDRGNALENMKEMQFNDEELEMELDRMLALLEKLEFEQKMQETIDKLNDLAKKQEELSKESTQKDSNTEDIVTKQEELNKEFDELKNDLAELQENNKETDLSKEEKAADDISKDMKNSKEQLDNNQKQKASDSQNDASEKMKEMAQSLSNLMSAMQMNTMTEDIESLRQLLENLVLLSFEQERLLNDFKSTSINTPKFVKLIQDQNKIIDDSKLVEDSLFALAKRHYEFETFINDEIKKINRNLTTVVYQLEDREVYQAVSNQQYIMTSYNIIALILSEFMSQMQQEIAQQMPGNQMCENPGNKPGSKSGKLPSLKQMQQQLSDQISEMSEMMKNGSSPGGKSGQSENLAKMAAQQKALRQALEEINREDNKDGKGSLGNLQKILDDMYQNEADLVNKNLTNELLNRQQEIITRLLEAENAEKERDEKEERKAISAKQYKNKIPPSLEEYINKQKGSIQLYRNIPPKLKPYYKNISQKFVDNIFNYK